MFLKSKRISDINDVENVSICCKDFPMNWRNALKSIAKLFAINVSLRRCWKRRGKDSRVNWVQKLLFSISKTSSRVFSCRKPPAGTFSSLISFIKIKQTSAGFNCCQKKTRRWNGKLIYERTSHVTAEENKTRLEFKCEPFSFCL